MVLDLDRFKLINDSIGHLAGDVLLKSRGNQVEAVRTRGRHRGRMGGDEFMILLHSISNARDCLPILDRIQEELRSPVYFRQQEMIAGTSVGVVIWSPKYNDGEDLLRAADTAMYQAKEAGRGCHRIFDEEMHDSVTRTLRAETDLRVAIRQAELLHELSAHRRPEDRQGTLPRGPDALAASGAGHGVPAGLHRHRRGRRPHGRTGRHRA